MKIAVFDLDHTLVQGNSSYCFIKYLRQKRILPYGIYLALISHYAVYCSRLISLRTLFNGCQKLISSSIPLQRLQEEACAFVNGPTAPPLFLPVVQRLEAAKERGYIPAILSTSPEFLVQAFAMRLRVGYWAGSKPALLVDGNQKLLWVVQLVDRLNRLHKLSLNLTDVVAYSDSIRDRRLLLSVGEVVAVNPDRQLLKLSLEKEWEIL